MAIHIHARVRESDGKGFFRLWTTEEDSYITEEMSEQEIFVHVFKDAVDDAFRTTKRRIAYASSSGSSLLMGSSRNINSPWSKEGEEE